MAKMKQNYPLVDADEMQRGNAFIIMSDPFHSPYVIISTRLKYSLFLKEDELEEFAVNILKALKSKKLK